MNFIRDTSLATSNVGISHKGSHDIVRVASVGCQRRTACDSPSKGEIAISRNLCK